MKSLAVTISGAVSLGAYEAGVLYEVLHALKAHNADPQTSDQEKIQIDVITGASAGGMSAAILAQKLLLNATALDGHDTNVLYQAWIEQVDLSGLLALKADEPEKRSLLSSDLVEGISKRMLTDRYASGHPPAPVVRHPAVADKVAIGMALSNLNGVDFGIPTQSGQEFRYTRFQDELVRILDSADPVIDTIETWEEIRNAAVACGAFPFAFRVKELIRRSTEYPKALDLPDDTLSFAYTDGGVFHNEPLGMAKNLVDLVDPNHLTHDSRYYLFIAPTLRSSAADGAFKATDATLVPTGSHLVKAIFNQARFKDWVRVEQVNTRIVAFESQVKALREGLSNGTLPPDAVKQTTAALISLVYPNAGTRQLALDRLAAQYASDLPTLPDKDRRDTWLSAVAVLEKIAGVEAHDPMKVYNIDADEKDLAGNCLCAFGGFFDQRYRRHDYELGRANARLFIENLNQSAKDRPGGLGPIRYAPDEPEPDVDPALSNVQPADLDEEKREALRDQIKGRIDEILSEHGVNLVVRAPIDYLLIRPKLDEWLGL